VAAGWELLHRRFSAYLALTKPTLQLLVVVTGAAALVLEGSLLHQPSRFAFVLICLALSAGSAKALNQFLERRVDAAMTRTRLRRPLPLGLIRPGEALGVAILLGIISVGGFWLFFNPQAALLSIATILFYSFFYTLYLKPRTPYSIVIGGVAGGMGPVIAWAAAAGSPSPVAWLMLSVVFFWTPPHFWSLAIRYNDDYRRIGYPMLPAVKSIAGTWRAIIRYAWMTALVSLALFAAGAGWIYGSAAVVSGGIFLVRIYRARNRHSEAEARSVFLYSIVYLLVLFAALIVDGIVRL
jgi:protoheme IX farnesyltransferase